jgi:hypothetical protein
MAQFDVQTFGARGDGRTLCTEAIQRAINQAASEGGGTVSFPPGVYLTANLFLKSNLTLDLQPGAVLRASPDLDHYTPMATGHNKDRQPYHFLVAEDCRNISIRGGGTLDGDGPAFWNAPPLGTKRAFSSAKPKRISPMLEFVRCQDLRLQDLRIINSPGWTVHLHECDRVWVRGVDIANDLLGPNTDGLDINGCRDVWVSDCRLICGDDAIVLKTSPDSRSCERVCVTNCVIQTYCAALKLGASESYHDMRQITFSNCVVFGSQRGIALYALEGGLYEDIAISNVVIETNCGFILNRPIHIEARKRKPESTPGRIRNVTISNITATTQGRILLVSADGGQMQGITLRDVRLRYPYLEDPNPWGAKAKSAQYCVNNPKAAVARGAVVADGVDDLFISGLRIEWPESPGVIPPDWQPPEGVWIQNGGDGQVPPVSRGYKGDPPFHAVWGRKLTRGRLELGGVKANAPDLAPVLLLDSEVTLARGD